MVMACLALYSQRSRDSRAIGWSLAHDKLDPLPASSFPLPPRAFLYNSSPG